MRYLHVAWLHDFPDEPVELYSELDDDSWEVRKIEYFRDGFIGPADSTGSTGRTRLGLEPVPPIAEIARNPEFRAVEISRDEFEVAWASAGPVVGSRLANES